MPGLRRPGSDGDLVVWNETADDEGATRGTTSAVIALPAWQAGMGVSKATGDFVGRGVSDSPATLIRSLDQHQFSPPQRR